MMNPKVVALYKTFRGHEFVTASIESIYNCVSAIVFVHSNVSWTGQEGNTVYPVVREWQEASDDCKKINHLWFDTTNQEQQYLAGYKYINTFFSDYDYIMFVDTDEVWDEWALNSLIDFTTHNQQYNAVCCRLHTYIKTPFMIITPIEPCAPTILAKRSVPFSGVRGNSIVPRFTAQNIFMHHFTYVRESDDLVFDKILTSTQEDGLSTIDLETWKKEKWYKLPNATDLHTSKGYEHYWKGVREVDISFLPQVFRNYNRDIIQRFQYAQQQDVISRHDISYKTIENNPVSMSVEERAKTEEYSIIKDNTKPSDSILEIGCLWGGFLLNLSLEGYNDLVGVEFLSKAVEFGEKEKRRLNANVTFINDTYPCVIDRKFDVVLLFDVLEHIPNVGIFLEAVREQLNDSGKVIVVLPKGRNYCDPVHINFYPDTTCLYNALSLYFNVSIIRECLDGTKLLAICIKR